ncbi:hypothetical protein DFH09DRAFT_1308744 [Mycena vulgaris]|nr:hypothetical protein DFH09DRAFT_1308744 [Mycena vulgaris]
MSTESKPLVIGAAGFLSFQVVHQLLEAGYAVRGAARGRKIPLLKKALEKYPQFETVEITDVATADYTKALTAMNISLSTRFPCLHLTTSQTAIEGSFHILREAEKAGVKKFVATGSIVTFPEKAEQAAEGNPFVLYIAEKKFGKQAVLEFANTHPAMDITIFCPPWIFGPRTRLRALLRADNVNYHYSPGVLDVRDVACIHIAGLNPLAPDHSKRVPIVSPYPTDFRDAIKYISDERPELRERLADPSKVPVWPSYKLDVDLAPVEKAFGISFSSYKTWREAILDAVDRFIDVEKHWMSNGFTVEVPTAPPM